MPIVRFRWDTQMVDVRRQVCPQAKWDKQARAWTMTRAEAEAFIAAVHRRLDFAKYSCEIAVDGERWSVGFIQGGRPQRI
jgi:hypothetical protein